MAEPDEVEPPSGEPEAQPEAAARHQGSKPTPEGKADPYPEAAGEAEDRHGDGKNAQKIAENIMFFNRSKVSAGIIGTGRGGATANRAPTGRLDDTEVRADRVHYCPPPGYHEAMERL